ncbi:MAG: hypothetical protein H0X37_25195 [Herpetosiphonaceae bacterium]|nr:hypothetical protein [Herpetosiphonaceae bacterium]
MDDAFWDKVEAVGVHLSYRFGGWYASCEAGHYGPYANREDAIADLISQLLERLHQAHAVIEGHALLLPRYRPDHDAERN